MIKLYIVRHAKTDWNEKGIIQGTTDIPLNEEGRRQAMALAQQIDLDNIDLCISSPLKRARETANLLVRKQMSVILDDLLVERYFDDLEGKTIDFDLIFKMWSNLDEKFGNSESTRECLNRASKFLDKIKNHYDGKSILIVSHGGFIKALHFNIIGYDKDTDFLSFKSENATIYEYELK